jgi:hypothetical protein
MGAAVEVDGQRHGGVVGEVLLAGFLEVAAGADLGAAGLGDEGVVESVALAACVRASQGRPGVGPGRGRRQVARRW